MITTPWLFNLMGGALLALIASAAMAEAKSSALIPKSLLLWPVLLVLFGALNLFSAWQGEIFVRGTFGIVLLLCGVQAALVNIRRLSPWPSGAVWWGLVLVGIGFQFYPLFLERVMGFLWAAIGIAKVARQRSASLESGTPVWIFLLYAQAILLAASR